MTLPTQAEVNVQYAERRREDLAGQVHPAFRDANRFNRQLDSELQTSDRRRLISELAALDPLEYDRRRQHEAEKLNVRVSVLDAEVKKKRSAAATDEDIVEDIEPWPEAVNGRRLLTELVALIRAHVVLSKSAAVACALWILHTYALDAARCSPILTARSPTPRCGKTTLQTLLAALAYRAILASNISPAALFRFVDRFHPTLILDELDTYIDGNEELRGVLNAGHTRDAAFVIRCDGEQLTPRKFSTWAPKSLALIGKLPATLNDRSIVIPMERKLTNQRIKRLPREPGKWFRDLRRRCRRWVDDNREALLANPALPGGLNDRASDNWMPLCAIAEAAAGRWARFARRAASQLQGTETDGDGVRELLLTDIAAVFITTCADRVSSADLAQQLAGLEARPWPEWKAGKPITANQIARLLAPFAIVPRTIRLATGTAKGYLRESFTEAFTRYLPPPSPSQSVTPTQSLDLKRCDGSSTVTLKSDVTVREPSQAYKNRDCNGVTVQFPQGVRESLVYCRDCRHFKPDTGENGMGSCLAFNTEAFPNVPFQCAGFTP